MAKTMAIVERLLVPSAELLQKNVEVGGDGLSGTAQGEGTGNGPGENL